MNRRPENKAEPLAPSEDHAAVDQLETPPRWIAGRVAGVAWLVNVALLLTAFSWVYFFGQSRDVIHMMIFKVLSSVSPAPPGGASTGGGQNLTTSVSLSIDDSSSGFSIVNPSRLGSGATIGLIAFGIALCTALVMLASLFVGGSRFRTTRMWLVFTAIACGWLGLLVSWPAVYWMGQQRRVAAVLPAAEALVDMLHSRWPKDDSELPAIGPFLAYPNGAPRALLALRDASFPNTRMRFSAVERTGDEAMRFELGGSEAGAWLEWRGHGSVPQSFVGGLATKYELGRVARLSPDWFLVRYEAAGLAE